MADAAFTEEIRSPRAARALAFATAFFFCALTAGALVITLLGKAHRPTWCWICRRRRTPKPPLPQTAMAEALPPPAVIDKPVFAGTALVADPALIENSPHGSVAAHRR